MFPFKSVRRSVASRRTTPQASPFVLVSSALVPPSPSAQVITPIAWDFAPFQPFGSGDGPIHSSVTVIDSDKRVEFTSGAAK